MKMRSTLRMVASALCFTLAIPAVSHAQTPAELALRIDRLEAQLRELTGLIQQLTFQVEDLGQLVAILRADNEALFQLLNTAGVDPALLAAATPVQPAGAANAITPGNAIETPAVGAGEPGAPLDLAEALRPDGNFNLNAASANGAEIPPAIEPPPAAIGPAAIDVAATGDAQADYNQAYQLLLSGDYALAQEAFTVFLGAYPSDTLAVDAKFWLAESLYSRGMYSEAANQFYSVFVANQDHAKAPDMLLKLGLSFVHLGQLESACDTFGLIPQRFPNASNALLDRVATEQANAGC